MHKKLVNGRSANWRCYKPNTNSIEEVEGAAGEAVPRIDAVALGHEVLLLDRFDRVSAHDR
jgi:hypothetical protein